MSTHSLHVMACAAIAALGVAAGWSARGPQPLAAPAPPVAAALLPAAADKAPLIAVASDGNVTLRVEQQPLAWVLEQIAMQSGTPTPAAPARPMTSAQAAPLAPEPAYCPQPAPRVEPWQVMQALASGVEDERFIGLMHARSAGIGVPGHQLKSLYESDASARVRLAALEAWIELHADRPEALRAALEGARHAPSADVRDEAGRRLVELAEKERIAALPPVPDP